jgi:hypothetical protein
MEILNPFPHSRLASKKAVTTLRADTAFFADPSLSELFF